MDAFRQLEQQAHDRAVDTYTEFFAPVTSGSLDDLLTAAGVRRGARVLDVATGPGSGAARAAALGAHVVGVDLSSAMIAKARARYPAIEFREGDAEALPFEAESFDAVICNFGISHFGDPDAVVREFARVLRPHGRVALTWWNFPSSRLNGVFLDAAAEAQLTAPPDLPTGPPVTRYSDPANLSALLRGAALTDITVADATWTVPVPTLDTWWSGGLVSMVRIAALVRAQAPDVQRRVRVIFDRLAERYRVGESYVVPMAARVGSGRKP